VHLHAVQGLGAGLVEEARAAGARVVVTMHDFWWSCGRQFLVARDLRPCSLVVEAGTCRCEVDRDWLDARDARLARALDAADAVLVPSRSAARVAAANGLARGRLHVDENGMAGMTTGPARVGRVRAPGEPVRLLYAGRSDLFKGVHVLLEAAELLRGTPGWSLVLRGAETHVAETAWRPRGLPVEVLPGYAPDELPEVLAAADVLVVPSLMRESHSLLTREALLAGLAVVCTDTLGPEEVVRHGENGLVVTAGDAQDLADALRRLVIEPGLLERMQRADPPAVRSLEEQVDGVERLYRSLVDDAPVTAPEVQVRRVVFAVGIEGAPLRYRARLPTEALALRGVHADVRHYRDPELPALAAAADAVVLYRVPATVQVLDLVRQVRARPEPVPVLFDVDDLVFDPDLADEIPALHVLPPEQAELWLEGVRRYRTTLEACDAFIGSTDGLVDHAAHATGLPALRFDNGVGAVLGRLSDTALRQPRRPGPLRVGYLSGTTTHDRDWQHVEAAVLEALDRHPEAELWLVGHLTPTEAVDRLGDRLVRLPLQDWRDLPGLLRDLDVNLAPLEPLGRFNEAKSAIKWLEAALVETPTVASPTQPFREAVVHGETGLLAATHEEWVQALDALLSDRSLRRRTGARARREALLRWSPHRQADRYLAVLAEARAVVAAGRPPRRTTWDPVAPDEPAVRSFLEPYTPVPVPGPTRRERVVVRLDGWRARALALYRVEGAGAVAQGVLRVARRKLGR